MAKKKCTTKRVSYKTLLEWRIANNLPDEWLIAVGGNMANEVYSLDQVRQMHVNSPTSIIQVLNTAQRQNPNAEWVVFQEVDKAAKETAGCAYTAAIFIPIVGLLIGLFMIANDKTRSGATGPIFLSIFMMAVWWVVIIAINS